MYALKKVVIFFGWVVFLTSLGGQAPHVSLAHMGHACGEPNEIELTTAHVLFYRPQQGGMAVAGAAMSGGTLERNTALAFDNKGHFSLVDIGASPRVPPHGGPAPVWYSILKKSGK